MFTGIAPGNYRVYALHINGLGEWLLPVRVLAGERTEVLMDYSAASPLKLVFVLPDAQ